jgi:hypothetical protein
VRSLRCLGLICTGIVALTLRVCGSSTGKTSSAGRERRATLVYVTFGLGASCRSAVSSGVQSARRADAARRIAASWAHVTILPCGRRRRPSVT